MQFDPIGITDSVNLYEFNRSNSISWIDLLGLFGTFGQPWPGLPAPPSTPQIINTPWDAYFLYTSGYGRREGILGDFYLSMFRDSKGFKELEKRLKRNYSSSASCNSSRNFEVSGKEHDFVTAEGPFLDYITFGWLYNETIGTIKEVSWEGRCSLKCEKPVVQMNDCCGCLCSLQCRLKFTLKDNYNFEGWNNVPLWFSPFLPVVAAGKPYDAKGEFNHTIEYDFIFCQ